MPMLTRYGSGIEREILSAQASVSPRNALFIIYFFSLLSVEVNFLTESSVIGNTAILLSGITLVMIILRGHVKIKVPHRSVGIDTIGGLTLFLVYALSVTWSVEAAVTVVQVCLFGSMLVAAFFFSELRSDFFIRVLLKVAFWSALISIGLTVIIPDIAWQPHWSTSWPELRGFFRHQQRFGLFLCTAFGVSLIARINRWPGIFESGVLKRYYLLMTVLIIGIFMSFARLYILFCVVSLLLTFMLSKYAVGRYVAMWMGLLFIGFIVTSDTTIVNDYIDRIDSGSSEDTLSGRTVVWERTLALAENRPLSGYGYGVFISPQFDWAWGVYRPPHAHNSFIQVYFDCGFIGLIALTVFVASHAIKSARSCKYEKGYSISMFIFMLMVLASLTGVTYAGKPSVLLGIGMLLISNRPEKYFGELKQ